MGRRVENAGSSALPDNQEKVAMGNYSKLIGAIVGPLLGIGATLGLPAAFTGPTIETALIALISAVVVWAFPANDSA